MGRGSVEAMLEALEQYLGGGGTGTERTPAQAYVAGVRYGYELARQPGNSGLRTRSTPPATLTPCGFRVSPLRDPPSTTNLVHECLDPESVSVPSLVDPDLKSTARAILERAETLELFPSPPEPAPTRKRRLPEEFCLTPALRRFAEAGGLNAAYEFAKFRDHYRGTGEVRSDWPATFRNWCRNALERRAERSRR